MSITSERCASGASKCCSVTQIITGVAIAAGVATLVWAVFNRRRREELDPLSEADRRINALESSLRRLEDSFGQAIGV
jgi:hypothetical protein